MRAAAGAAAAPTPPGNGRKIIQSAQLTLTAAPAKVETVAQEVFDVVGRESGVVRSSNVTATGGLDSSAEFELSVPSSSLGRHDDRALPAARRERRLADGLDDRRQ